MKLDPKIVPGDLLTKLENFWNLASGKAARLDKEFNAEHGSPVYTVNGRYTSRGWTEWTRGFQYGIPLLVFGATGNRELLELGRKNTLGRMADHLTHSGIHDHAFNNLSSYGNLLRLARKGTYECSIEEKEYCRLAVKVSGAIQALRWTKTTDGGYIYSFNGPHSLFIDTLRTCRILLASHRLGHRLLTENDLEVDLSERAITHALTTARYSVYYGEGRDAYDIPGRVAHESLFNTTDGRYRCPNSQQGYSAYSTWTRGLAWAMLGFTELLEYLEDHGSAIADVPDPDSVRDAFLKAARATCDFYLEHTSLDGIPYWDTGAPQLEKLGRYQDHPADPFNPFEPVDSSAAAIGAQGLVRLGNYLAHSQTGSGADESEGKRYLQAGLTVLRTLLSAPYISTEETHQGILLHTVYHRPNGWDHIPEGQKVPCGESGMWGDYHLAELCFLVHQLGKGEYYTFFDSL